MRIGISRLLSHSAIYTATALATRGAAFLLLPVYTRFLGPEGFGAIAAASVVTSVLGVLLPLSLHAALARVYHDEADDEARRSAAGSVWVAVVTLAFAGTVALDVFGQGVFDALFRSVPFDPLLRIAIWTACFNAVGLVPLQLLQTSWQVRAYAAVSCAGVVVTTAVSLWLVVARSGGVEGYLIGTMVGAAFTAAAATLVARRGLRPALRGDVLGRAFLFGLPLLPHLAASWVIDLSDRYLLERFVPLAQLGVYAVGYQVGLLMSVLASSVNAALAPHLYAADAARGRDGFASEVGRVTTYCALGLGAAAAALAVLAVDIVAVFAAADFAAADTVARPVILAYLVVGLYYIPINVLFVRGRTGVVPLVTGAAAALNIGLNIAFIPRYGATAAAWATTASYVAMLALMGIAASRVQRVAYEARRLGVITVAFLVTAGAGWAASDIGGLEGSAVRIAIIGLYPTLLVILRFASPAELSAMRALASALVRVVRRGGAPAAERRS